MAVQPLVPPLSVIAVFDALGATQTAPPATVTVTGNCIWPVGLVTVTVTG